MKALKNKTGLLVFMLLMLVLATMLGFLLTQGRYSEELQSGSDMYDSELEYIVADQVEVSSVEEFIAAVENGYSNITIADDVDDPLIITSGITDVGADLIIDLNGHEIQRNNREPMLNIIEGVRLTVIDSSTSQTGSFYNPVGSVLQIDGGTLTVTAGTFTSGPRSEEYAGTGTYASESGGYVDSFASLTVREKNENGSGYTESVESAPIILPEVTSVSGSDSYFVNGNMYFDKGWTAPAGAVLSSDLITPDTYFYFVIDDDTASNTTIAASQSSADFYYTYNVTRSETNGNVTYEYPAEGDNVVTVTVYGYHNVKSSAAGENDVTPDYATVKMISGNMYTRGGAYESLFGEANTYGIYASGGYMAVSAGDFSAKEAATCVACAYGEDADASEFLQVTGGEFSSEYGDTVSVSGGNMVLTGGIFTLNANNAPAENNSAAVSVTGGTLNASNASGLTFSVTANALDTSVTYGIMVNDGTADIRNAAFTFEDGTYIGMRGVSVSGGSATLSGTNFTFGGTNSTYTDAIGISAEGGSITATNVDISINSSIADGTPGNANRTPGNANRGIYSDGGTVQLYGDCTIEIDGSYSAGILAVSSASSLTGSTDSIIYGSAGDESEYTLKIDVSGTANSVLSSTAMSTEGGSINIASGNVEITSDGLGVTTRSGGGITFSGETFDVTTFNGTGIYVNGGNIDFNSGTVTVNSDVDESYSWSGVPTASGGYEETDVVFYDGIVVDGGSLDASGSTLNVNFTSNVENTYSAYESGDRTVQKKVTENVWDWGSWDYVVDTTWSNINTGETEYFAYDNLVVSSYAVRVTSGSTEDTVTITNGSILNLNQNTENTNAESYGGGLYVNGATVVLGVPNGSGSLNISSTGDSYEVEINDETGADDAWYNISGTDGTWAYKLNRTGGHAVEVAGGDLTVHYGEYTAAYGNGILVSNGTATINDGTFIGADPYLNHNGTANSAPAGAAASYGVKMYGGTLNINGGTFGDANSVGSGAFIMGMSSSATATANIIGGTFSVKGTAGVSVYENAAVTFGSEGSSYTDENTKTDWPTVMGGAAGMTVEVVGSSAASTINIYGGTFSGSDTTHANNDGIWYGNTSTVLNIHGGRFTTASSNGRAGLTIEGSGSNVNLSGGIFIGNNSRPFNGSATVGTVLATGYSMYYDGQTNAISTNIRISNLSSGSTVVVR